MTVISIGGCTALMLTAFGLKEAIACIAESSMTISSFTMLSQLSAAMFPRMTLRTSRTL